MTDAVSREVEWWRHQLWYSAHAHH